MPHISVSYQVPELHSQSLVKVTMCVTVKIINQKNSKKLTATSRDLWLLHITLLWNFILNFAVSITNNSSWTAACKWRSLIFRWVYCHMYMAVNQLSVAKKVSNWHKANSWVGVKYIYILYVSQVKCSFFYLLWTISTSGTEELY